MGKSDQILLHAVVGDQMERKQQLDKNANGCLLFSTIVFGLTLMVYLITG